MDRTTAAAAINSLFENLAGMVVAARSVALVICCKVWTPITLLCKLIVNVTCPCDRGLRANNGPLTGMRMALKRS